MSMLTPYLARGLIAVLLLHLIACRTHQQRPVYRIKVQSGESLAYIAAKYGTSWQRILIDNGIRDYREVKVGQELLIRPGPGGYLPIGTQPDQVDVSAAGALTTDSSADKTSKSRTGLLFGDSAGKASVSGSNESAFSIWPVEGSISSFYGPRRGRFHYGIDIRAEKGTDIKAVAAGRVVFRGWQKGYGKTVIIEHAGGKRTLYGHCSSYRVKDGQRVRQGQVIAKTGATGNARGSHLHFEVQVDQVARDPLNFLPAGQGEATRSTGSIAQQGFLP